MGKQKIYFPNLNGIRFIAAFLVILHHIEQYKSFLHFPNYYAEPNTVPFIEIIGHLGVILFFVLSGFLITFLLLSEEKAFATISIKKFYVRRILRIWPLYFLIIVVALFILPHIDIFTLPGFGKGAVYNNLLLKILFYVFFLPNLVFAKFGVVPFASHTWSIGTEEQFYLIWPVLMKFLRKHRITVMFVIAIGYILVHGLLLSNYTGQAVITKFWELFSIDCMAIGGIYAILLFKKDRLLKLLMNNYLFYFILLFVIALIIKGQYIPQKTIGGFVLDIHNEFYAVLFGIIILNFAANDKIKISLENRLFNYLGNISYGLYMYHPIGIMLSLYIAISINFISNWLLYPLSVLTTITLAGLSYKYFETYFLKFKAKFSKIISGKDTKE
jgi:peptidoglycan/LPS O-acetylase OafA/YrhL